MFLPADRMSPAVRELWLSLWFFIGVALYWMKRAYYLVTGPNPVANTYSQFFQRCWIPLVVRAFIDYMVFLALFIPGVGENALQHLGWTSFASTLDLLTKYAPFAALFGHTVDSIMDFAVSKIPFLNTILPQMPGPLPRQPTLPTPPVPNAEQARPN